jgi:hypothetical protein
MLEKEIKLLKKLFGGQVFSYPMKSYENKSYFRTLEAKLLLFEEKIKQLPNDNVLFDKIKSQGKEIELLNERLINSISNYLWGSQKRASAHFESLIDSSFVKEKLLNLSETLERKTKNKLFRIRTSENELNEREELFHIPFTKRHLVANQRFSIAGLPCLYLGSSIYVCWLEIQKPNFSDIYVSGFKTIDSLRVINLAYSLESIINDLENSNIEKDKFIEKFLLWPLIMACSFQTKYPKAPFHEEYIIPGLLLEWITFSSEEISGLKYLSTKLNSLKKKDYGVNYVIPPQNLKDHYEYCPVLSREFILTNPLSWELLTILPPADVVAHGSGIKAENIEDALLDNYEYSRFGFVEEQVFSMTFDTLKKPKPLTRAHTS